MTHVVVVGAGQAGLALERERAAAAAARAEQNAEAEAARNTLLASLSHDLRTPLAGVVGSASALRTQGAELGAAGRDQLLENLEGEARDLALMADNILQIARLSQPQGELTSQWESIEDVLEAARDREERERVKREKLQAGALSYDLDDLRRLVEHEP